MLKYYKKDITKKIFSYFDKREQFEYYFGDETRFKTMDLEHALWYLEQTSTKDFYSGGNAFYKKITSWLHNWFDTKYRQYGYTLRYILNSFPGFLSITFVMEYRKRAYIITNIKKEIKFMICAERTMVECEAKYACLCNLLGYDCGQKFIFGTYKEKESFCMKIKAVFDHLTI